MDKSREDMVEQLKRNDTEFRRLWEEHQELKRQLAVFRTKPVLMPHDEIEVKRLKKIKLAGKDRMETILHENRSVPIAS